MRRSDRGGERRAGREPRLRGRMRGGRGVEGEQMKKRMRQLLEADVRMSRGRAMRNNTGMKGTWDGGVKKRG